MAQAVNVNFRLDEDVKRNMEQVCSELGLTISAAFTIFAKKVSREKRIPFELSVDPFYSEENMTRLRKSIDDLNAGKGTIHEVDYE
ncbi:MULTISPECIES: type II toxin-antitoxin system RelB/DinJ family antitoxin [Bacteria]|jgi:DNA-damage-inducible protein J|uniref:type II toxin-antitoxin system RelB/DinJ family antitoxin n=1 Tax=Pseudomonadati TaxID=3379134 RepID=UPI002638EF16|nr:type II toxin-antitoxin system RelB/DinJ family antitoxin [Helicobacter sp. UBA3407]MCI9053509.1 type II toxin-antitoxin system RelB/DinJ family antitoxin [Lachnospiraceae bacterium]